MNFQEENNVYNNEKERAELSLLYRFGIFPSRKNMPKYNHINKQYLLIVRKNAPLRFLQLYRDAALNTNIFGRINTFFEVLLILACKQKIRKCCLRGKMYNRKCS